MKKKIQVIRQMKKNKIIIVYIISILVLIGLILYSAKTGSIEMTFGKLLRGLFIEYDPDVATIYDLRFPRIIISILAGAALANRRQSRLAAMRPTAS